MTLEKQTYLNEFFVRMKDDGSGIQGVHVADVERILENGVLISARMLEPRAVNPGDAPALAQIADAFNLAALATVDAQAVEIAALTAAKTEVETARDTALAEVESLRTQLLAYQTPVDENGVPKEVTMRQAQLALLSAGLLDDVEAAIASIPGDAGRAATITWTKSAAVKRDNPLIAQLAAGLGLSSTSIDNLFKLAATL